MTSHFSNQLLIALPALDDPHFSRRFYRAALAREALLRPIGNTVYLMPPYIVSTAEIDHLAQAAYGALTEALAGR